MDPSNTGNVRCRFGRVLTYQDALEQFEVLVTLPIMLIGVTPQDLLELTDITSLKQQVSPMSTPERRMMKMGSSKTDLPYRSPHRLASPSSTPDRSGLARMDLRDRLGPNETSTSRVANLDMRNRFSAQAVDKHEYTVTPNRSVHTVSAKSRMDETPEKMPPPRITADLTKEKPNALAHKWGLQQSSRATSEIVMAAAAVKSSNSNDPADISTNPFFIPSPKTPIPKVAEKSAEISEKDSSAKKKPVADIATAKPAANAQVGGNTKSTGGESSTDSPGVLMKIVIALVAMLFILWPLSSFFTETAKKVEQPPAFTDKPVSIYSMERIFADPNLDYQGLLIPDIIFADF
jgi:hypothetical protein